MAAPKEKQIGRSANQTNGKARVNMTLLKMLNGLIKPDWGTITMRGRVGALIALGAAFPRPSALDARLLLSINGSVLGLTKTH